MNLYCTFAASKCLKGAKEASRFFTFYFLSSEMEGDARGSCLRVGPGLGGAALAMSRISASASFKY